MITARIDEGAILAEPIESDATELFAESSFLFDEAAYKEAYVYSLGNSGTSLRNWSKVNAFWAIIGLPIAAVSLFAFFTADVPMSTRLYFLIFPALEAVIIFLALLGRHRHRNPRWKHLTVGIDDNFGRVKAGGPLSFADYMNAMNEKGLMKAMERSRSRRRELREDPGSAHTPYEHPFTARVYDDRITVGREGRAFVSDYANEIECIYESANYLGVCNKGLEDALFRKDSLSRGDAEGLKAFLKAKRRGRDVALSDYVGPG